MIIKINEELHMRKPLTCVERIGQVERIRYQQVALSNINLLIKLIPSSKVRTRAIASLTRNRGMDREVRMTLTLRMLRCFWMLSPSASNLDH